MLIETNKIIKEFTTDIASQMDIHLSKIVLVEGHKLGCLDTHLMKLSSGLHLVSVLIYQSDIDNLINGNSTDRFETKIRIALSQLHKLIKVANDPKCSSCHLTTSLTS